MIKSFQAGKEDLKRLEEIKMILARERVFPTDSDIIREAVKILYKTISEEGGYVWDSKKIDIASKKKKVGD